MGQIVTFSDFPKGFINNGANEFAFPDGALRDGRNVRLSEGGIKTRPGSSVMSAATASDFLVTSALDSAGLDVWSNRRASISIGTSYPPPMLTNLNIKSNGVSVLACPFDDTHILTDSTGNWNVATSAVQFVDVNYPTWNGIAPLAYGTAGVIYGLSTLGQQTLASIFAGSVPWEFDCTIGLADADVDNVAGEEFISIFNTSYFGVIIKWSTSGSGSTAFDLYLIKSNGTAVIPWSSITTPLATALANLPSGVSYQDWQIPAVTWSGTALRIQMPVALSFDADGWHLSANTLSQTVPAGLQGTPNGLPAGNVQQLFQARFPTLENTYLVAQVQDPNTGAWGLYACKDHLPTSTGVFTKIYDFGGVCGVARIVVLNDRMIITDGIAKPPLVWGGCMATDASDWMHPKTVLVSQDGQTFYDVSNWVCDADPDTVAQVGNIRPWGYIAICTDMPQVEGFWFDVESPNLGGGGGGANNFHAPMQITGASSVNRQDLKDTIVNWVQDSLATGHFTDSGNVAVSIGVGNTNPDVIPGVLVEFADAELQILSVTGDGTASGAVTLSAAHANAAISEIYGLMIETTPLSLSLPYIVGGMTAAYTAALTSGTLPTSAGFSIRQVVSLASGGDHLRITLKSAVSAYGSGSGALQGFGASHVSIVPRSGSTADGTATPTEITFNGGQSGCSITTQNTELVSDIVPFTSTAGDYIVIIDVVWATFTWGGSPYRAGFLASMPSGVCYTKDGGYGLEATSWNQQTVTGFTQQAITLGVDKVEVSGIDAVVPINTYVATSASPLELKTGIYEAVVSATPVQTQPGASLVYWAISQDGRSSFQVFNTGAWRLIAQLSGATWQYNDSVTTTPNWVNASTNSVYGALRQAFTVAQNQMTAAQLAAITQTQWQSAGGFIPHITTTLDFAVGMAADGSNVPTVSALDVVYANAGQAIIQVFKNGQWTDVTGWTDGTIAGGQRLGQSGIIGGSVQTADYSVLDQIPGYWWRLLTEGTSPLCAITEIRYQAPCQLLSNIGDGQPDIGQVILYFAATNSILDVSQQMADNTLTPMASAAIPMTTDDHFYVGYMTKFDQIMVSPYADPSDTTFTNNQVAAALSGEYWTGEAWAALTIYDGTIGSAGNTLAEAGLISWTIPTDWRTSIPFDAFFSRGYWVRFHVSAALTSTAALSELRVYGVPEPLKKYQKVALFGNRIALGNKPDAPDQVDISRPFEEYGWTGQNAGSFRLGGGDQIASMIDAWNGILVGKTSAFFFLQEGASSFQSVEAGRHTPLSTSVIVKAPVSGFDYGDRYGLFFINRYGAFVATGLHTDSLYNTSRGKIISDVLSFWDPTMYPRLDLNHLYMACGEYWPVKNWILWAVPMIFPAPHGSTETVSTDAGRDQIIAETAFKVPGSVIAPNGASGLQLGINADLGALFHTFTVTAITIQDGAAGTPVDFAFNGASSLDITQNDQVSLTDYLAFAIDPTHTYYVTMTNTGTPGEIPDVKVWQFPSGIQQGHYDNNGVWYNDGYIDGQVPLIYQIITGNSPSPPTSQATNNALIVYDLNLNAWLPPFVFPFDIAILSAAYHYNADVPGKLGDVGMYAGTYDGRIIRLFDPSQTKDLGDAITGFAEWGYLNHGEPQTEKSIERAWVYGKTEGTKISLQTTGLLLLEDDQISIINSQDFTRLPATDSGIDYQHRGMDGTDRGQMLKYRVDFDGYTELHMVQVDVNGLRDEPGT